MKQTQKKKLYWYGLAVIAVLLAAPNGTIIKTTMDDIGPLWFNVLRFALITLIMVPFMIRARHSYTKTNLKYTLYAGLAYAVAVTGYTAAIDLSQASYVSIIDLGIPVLLMLYSVYLTRERVSRKAFVGIGIAALGGFAIVALPLVASQGIESGFHPLATVFAIVNCVSFPLLVIFSRKANEAGLSLWATFGITAFIAVVVSLAIVAVGGFSMPEIAVIVQPSVAGAIVYSAIVVSLLARIMTVAAYERIGSAAVAGLHYVEVFLAIIIPILLLSERMTIEMLIGGVLILIGVIIIETKHYPQLHRHRRHMPRHT